MAFVAFPSDGRVWQKLGNNLIIEGLSVAQLATIQLRGSVVRGRHANGLLFHRLAPVHPAKRQRRQKHRQLIRGEKRQHRRRVLGREGRKKQRKVPVAGGQGKAPCARVVGACAEKPEHSPLAAEIHAKGQCNPPHEFHRVRIKRGSQSWHQRDHEYPKRQRGKPVQPLQARGRKVRQHDPAQQVAQTARNGNDRCQPQRGVPNGQGICTAKKD